MSGLSFLDEVLPNAAPTRADTSVGAPSTISEDLSSMWWMSRLTQNTGSKDLAIDAARTERDAAIQKMTGKPVQDLIAPYLADTQKSDGYAPPANPDGGPDLNYLDNIYKGEQNLQAAHAREQQGLTTFSPVDRATDQLVDELKAKGQGTGLLNNVELVTRAHELALKSITDQGDVEARSSGLSSTLARFAGAAGNSLTDPAMVSAMILAAPADAAIVPTMLIEGAAGGVGSALSLPSISKWHKELGLGEQSTTEKVGQVAFDAAVSAGTAGLIKGGGHGFGKLFSPRQAVDAFDRAFPDYQAAPPDLRAKRDVLDTIATLGEENPLPHTPAGDAEHLKRMVAVEDAVNTGQPLPQFPEDVKPPVVDQTGLANHGYQLHDPATLKTDAQIFQYKDNANQAGVTDRLRGVENWDQSKAGVGVVWQNNAGEKFVADGHQRHDLAMRAKAKGQDPKILALTLKEADGVSATDARVIAATKNIAEGTGTPLDAAKIIRARPDMALDLPPTSALVKQARGLAALNDDAFKMVVNGVVPENYAALVGRMTKDRPDVQSSIMGILAKHDPSSELQAESMIRDALDAPQVQATMSDLFGSSEQTQVLFKERAQVLSGAAATIKKDKSTFAHLVGNKARIENVGNKLNHDANAGRLADDELILQNLQRLARRKGPIGDALAQAAKDIAEGKSKSGAIERFLGDVRAAAKDEHSMGLGSGKSQFGAPEPIAPDPLPDRTPNLSPTGPVNRLTENVPEPHSPEWHSELDGLEADLKAKLADGSKIDVQPLTDGRFKNADDLFADLDRDKEFLDAVKVCLQ